MLKLLQTLTLSAIAAFAAVAQANPGDTLKANHPAMAASAAMAKDMVKAKATAAHPAAAASASKAKAMGQAKKAEMAASASK
jgi:hypothetical protein